MGDKVKDKLTTELSKEQIRKAQKSCLDWTAKCKWDDEVVSGLTFRELKEYMNKMDEEDEMYGD